QNANDGDHDHQFDQCKTLLLSHYVLLELIKPKNQQLIFSMVYANSKRRQGREPGYAHPTPPPATASAAQQSRPMVLLRFLDFPIATLPAKPAGEGFIETPGASHPTAKSEAPEQKTRTNRQILSCHQSRRRIKPTHRQSLSVRDRTVIGYFYLPAGPAAYT